MNAEILKKFSDKIIIKIENRNQEKEMIHTCRMLGHKLVRKDAIAYNEEKKPIFPIYYGFYVVGDKIQSWWDINDSWMKKGNNIIISYKCFIENVKEDENKDEEIYEKECN